MEPLSVYLTHGDSVDVVHCHKGWSLEQVLAAHGDVSSLSITCIDDGKMPLHTYQPPRRPPALPFPPAH